jgi:hypothetical protein
MAALPQQVSLPPVVKDAIMNALELAATTAPAAGQADIRTPAMWAWKYYKAKPALVDRFSSNFYLACWNQISKFPADKYTSTANFMVGLNYAQVVAAVAATVAVLATFSYFSGQQLFDAGIQAGLMPATLKQDVAFFLASASKTEKIAGQVCEIGDLSCPADVAKTLDYLNTSKR